MVVAVGWTYCRTVSSIVEAERHQQRYARAEADVLRAMEREVLDSDYLANGYTTRAQADLLGDALDLGPGRLLLDVGAGCGWPGLYLATRHGCSVVVVDPIVTGVETARRRTIDDGITDQASTAVASAEGLPFRPASVDAIVHTDVMC